MCIFQPKGLRLLQPPSNVVWPEDHNETGLCAPALGVFKPGPVRTLCPKSSFHIGQHEVNDNGSVDRNAQQAQRGRKVRHRDQSEKHPDARHGESHHARPVFGGPNAKAQSEPDQGEHQNPDAHSVAESRGPTCAMPKIASPPAMYMAARSQCSTAMRLMPKGCMATHPQMRLQGIKLPRRGQRILICGNAGTRKH